MNHIRNTKKAVRPELSTTGRVRMADRSDDEDEDEDELLNARMKMKTIKLKFTARRVVSFVKKLEVNSQITVPKTDKAWVGQYQEALTRIMNELDSEELADFTKKAELWNTEPLPKEVQMEYVIRL